MAKDKNRYGQYFTIQSIAKFMVLLISHCHEAKVLEPSCGKGVFLSQLLECGYSNICAYEIDPTVGNPYDFVRYESFISTPLSERFDVVIGNPPYIRWKNLEAELKQELSSSFLWNKYFNSLCDYLFIFILKGIEQLEDGGELIFICPEYWMNTTHSLSLRNYMVENGCMTDIFHFKEAPLFEGVTSSFVIFRYVKGACLPEIQLHKYNRKGKPSYEELATRECFSTIPIPQFKASERWILLSREKQESLANFEKHCARPSGTLFESSELNRIGDVCDIGNGMVSGLDKAFQLVSTENLTERERRNVLRVFKAKDLAQYYNINEKHYIFINEELTEEEFNCYYPTFQRCLAPFSEELKKRYNYGRELPAWEFAFPRNYALFSRNEPRIFIPCKERISSKRHFRFAYAEQGVFPLQDVTGIFRKKNCRESLEYILSYLNNERVFDWLTSNGIVKGDIVEFSEAPIASIPFRPINWECKEEVRIHDEITAVVKLLLETKIEKYKHEVNNLINLLFDDEH